MWRNQIIIEPNKQTKIFIIIHNKSTVNSNTENRHCTFIVIARTPTATMVVVTVVATVVGAVGAQDLAIHHHMLGIGAIKDTPIIIV